MQIVRLPKQLPGELDLAALNQRLRAGEVRLDWSDVEPAVEQQTLSVLFAGLNLADHIEDIGATTIPESLMPAILIAFENATAESNGANYDISPPASATPQLWLPETETPTDEIEDRPIQEPADHPAYSRGVPLWSPAVGSPALEAPSPAALREELQSMVLRDLLGPAGGEDEEVDEARVRERYLVGMLAPNEVQTVPEELDELASSEDGSAEDEPADADVTQKVTFSPSSIGMSFCVDLDATSLLITARWGHYKREGSQVLKNQTGSPTKIWQRYQRGGVPKLLPLKEESIKEWSPDKEQPEVFVKGVIRRTPDNWMVTLFL